MYITCCSCKNKTVFLIESVSTLHWSLTLTLKWPSGKSGRCGQSGGHSKQPFRKGSFIFRQRLIRMNKNNNNILSTVRSSGLNLNCKCFVMGRRCW